jgi:hypothetical protein
MAARLSQDVAKYFLFLKNRPDKALRNYDKADKKSN